MSNNNIKRYASQQYVDEKLLEFSSQVGGGADWNQNDETAKDYIKNRTHYTESEVIVTWDGNTEGLVEGGPEGGTIFYKISDYIIDEDLLDKGYYKWMSNTDTEYSVANGYPCDGCRIGDYAIFVLEDNVEAWFMNNTFKFPTAGIYCDINKFNGNYLTSLSVDITKPIDEKYIPDTIARVYYVDDAITNLVGLAPEARNTIEELATAIAEHEDVTAALDSAITNKVDKVEGKGLSSNDFTDELKAKYDEMYENKNIFDGIYLRDIENGQLYLVQMKGGTLVSSSKTVSIQVSKEPDKMIYYSGEAFNPTGMIVSTTCEDGTQKIISNYTCSDIVDGIVTITYIEAGTEYTTNISVTIRSLEDELIDFEYTKNADGTYTLTAWKQTLNGEPSTEMVFPDLESIIM